MELTRKESIDLSKELWTWLAETGGRKEDWPEWERFGGLHEIREYDAIECRAVVNLSFLCEEVKLNCYKCSYWLKFGNCKISDKPFTNWFKAKTEPDKKKYAQMFLDRLNQLEVKE